MEVDVEDDEFLEEELPAPGMLFLRSACMLLGVATTSHIIRTSPQSCREQQPLNSLCGQCRRWRSWKRPSKSWGSSEIKMESRLNRTRWGSTGDISSSKRLESEGHRSADECSSRTRARKRSCPEGKTT